MSTRKQPDTSKVKDQGSYKQVCALLDLDRGLTDWEVGFIESIVEHLERGSLLTEKQKNKLEDIQDRVDGRSDNDDDLEC